MFCEGEVGGGCSVKMGGGEGEQGGEGPAVFSFYMTT